MLVSKCGIRRGRAGCAGVHAVQLCVLGRRAGDRKDRTSSFPADMVASEERESVCVCVGYACTNKTNFKGTPLQASSHCHRAAPLQKSSEGGGVRDAGSFSVLTNFNRAVPFVEDTDATTRNLPLSTHANAQHSHSLPISPTSSKALMLSEHLSGQLTCGRVCTHLAWECRYHQLVQRRRCLVSPA